MESTERTNGSGMREPYLVLCRSAMSEPLSVEVAAAKISAPIEEKATRACFELVQSSAWNILAPPAGRYSPEM